MGKMTLGQTNGSFIRVTYDFNGIDFQFYGIKPVHLSSCDFVRCITMIIILIIQC